MPLSSRLAGRRSPDLRHQIDARKLMAFAAGIGDMSASYMDTASEQGIVGHPLFPVTLEWPSYLAISDFDAAAPLTPTERAAGVHAEHDLLIHRQIRPGDRLVTSAEIVGLGRRKSGAFKVIRLDTSTEGGDAVCTTYQTIVHRGTDLLGEPTFLQIPPDSPTVAERGPVRSTRIKIPEGLAHIYTECAGIWNPIHTDRSAALAAGLSGIILHGTATLAIALSELVAAFLGGDPGRVCRVQARFTGFVPLPDDLELRACRAGGELVTFAVCRGNGTEAISDGRVYYRETGGGH